MNDAEKAAFYEGTLIAINEQRWDGHPSFLSMRGTALKALQQTGALK